MSDVIEVKNVFKNFGNVSVLNDLSLNVPVSSVFALLGPNGAGKSTLIKTLVNMYQPNSGEIKILGINSRNLSPQEMMRIGFVAEDQDVPEWMTLKQLIDFCESLYPNWDKKFCAHLVNQFDLRMDDKIKNYSRGMRMKAILLCALAYRPELLILDEPFSGFDPGVKQEVIAGVLDITENEGWTIFISSHDIDEVEKLADRVCIVKEGHVILNEKMDILQDNLRQVEVFTSQAMDLTGVCIPKTWQVIAQEGRMIRFLDQAYQEQETPQKIATLFPMAQDTKIKTLSLNEIFLLSTQKSKTSAERGV
jgi:ABC-2 type transport system ATP-binding protein